MSIQKESKTIVDENKESLVIPGENENEKEKLTTATTASNNNNNNNNDSNSNSNSNNNNDNNNDNDNDNNSPIKLIEKLHEDIEKLRSRNENSRVVLLAVDSSSGSLKAVEWVSKYDLKIDDIIILFTVWEDRIDLSSINYIGSVHTVPAILPANFIDSKEIYRLNKNNLDNSKNLLKNMYKKYFHNNENVLSLLVSTHYNDNNSIGKIIINASNKLNVDLLVIGSRGLGKIQKFFMGSVSKYIIEHTTCPILLIKN